MFLKKISIPHDDEILDLKPEWIVAPPISPRQPGALSRIFSSGYTAAVTSAAAAMLTGGVVLDNFIEANFDARSGWSGSAECNVTDTGNRLKYHFVSNASNERPREVFKNCAEVFSHKNFNFGGMEIGVQKSIRGLPGMDGKTGSPMTGYNMNFEKDDAVEAQTRLDDLAFQSLELQMKWNGRALTGDWFLYKGLVAQREIGNGLNAAKTQISQWAVSALDGTIGGLEKAKAAVKSPSP